MATLKSLKAKFEKHPEYKTPRRIYDLQEEPAKGNPREIAEHLLRKIAEDIGISSDLSQLKFDSVKTNVLGSLVLFQQYQNNTPISDAWVRVYLDKNLKVYQIVNDLIPQKVLARTVTKVIEKPKLTEGEATELALAETGSKAKRSGTAKVVGTEQVYWQQRGVPILAWKVLISATEPTREWKVYINAEDGTVLDKADLIKRAVGQGKVFDPNPVVTLNDTSLEDTSHIPDEAYYTVPLNALDSNGTLDGPFVSTANTANRIRKEDMTFLFTRGERAFNEVMVYYHIDRVQRYIQELGFDNVLNHPIKVNADGIPDDNSFYSPMTQSLTFGRGGVDDAEDADIILHEYGHAIQDNQVPGFGASHEAGSMGEGFGDYLAGSFFADIKSDILKPCVGTWDGVAYSGAEPPCLRRLDSNKKYPKDMVREVHDDGEIWSACLWELRNAVGRTTADTLIIAHHFLLSRNASFEDGANALMTADEQMYQGRNKNVIRDIFSRRGILPNPKRKNRRAGVNFHKS